MKNKIPPPVLLLITGAIMWLVARSEYGYPIAVPYPLALAIALAATGLFIAVLAMRRFNAAETTVNPLAPESATSLVDGGIYRRTRNPMYAGLLLILAGWALWLGSLTSIAVIVLFVVAITELQIKPEEKALRALFGGAYEEYCRKVRRWV